MFSGDVVKIDLTLDPESHDQYVTILISPHRDHINLHFSGIGDHPIRPHQTVANDIDIYFKM